MMDRVASSVIGVTRLTFVVDAVVEVVFVSVIGEMVVDSDHVVGGITMVVLVSSLVDVRIVVSRVEIEVVIFSVVVWEVVVKLHPEIMSANSKIMIAKSDLLFFISTSFLKTTFDYGLKKQLCKQRT